MSFETLAAELNELADRGLTRRRRMLDGPQGAQVQVDGRPLLAFASNDYLGLANHPQLIAAAQEGAARYGVGSGASHLVLGHSAAHQALEEALAEFVALPRALLFSTGYMANIGIVAALAGRNDAVFADRLNHASLNDAALLSGAAFKRYPHGDVAALEQRLAASRARRRLIVTDAVFSMDGDIAPLPELVTLAERYDAWLVVDDAHGFGVLGAEGRGTLDHLGLHSPRIVYMGTLGKAAGVYGAFVAAQGEVIETLLQRARTYIYTTATPPLLAHVLLHSLTLVRTEQWRRDRLTQHVALLKSRLADSRFRLLASDTAIQPLIVGDNDAAVAASDALLADGILVPAIRPPTVPVNTARLRISLSAAHDVADVERLAAALLSL
ncbi:MAG TPA: 8-amino-7-oxononanoate synthase [Burkholderiales bacterium]|nr:8-amino-7-oxononanoate synthase [Burkholderiales bacterium]